MIVKNEVTKGDIVHIILLFFTLVTWVVAGAAWKQSVEDKLQMNFDVVSKTNQRMETMQSRIDAVKDSEEQQLKGIDRRLSRVEGQLHVRDGGR